MEMKKLRFQSVRILREPGKNIMQAEKV